MDFGPTPGDDDGDDDGPKEQPLDFSGRARKAKAITDKQVIQALAENAVELKPEQIARMNPAQRGETLTWAQACRLERDKGGDVFTFPTAPSFVLKPAELMGPPPPVADAGDVLETPKKAKAARAPKPRGKFTNTPRVTKTKKGKK